VLMLINLYVDDNIGRDELDEHGEGGLSCTLLRRRELDEPRATAEDTLPQVGQGKNKPLRGRWLEGWI
ncbi:MAG: hypothetical protein QW659_04985, partial [Sulfolobales archaeon]